MCGRSKQPGLTTTATQAIICSISCAFYFMCVLTPNSFKVQHMLGNKSILTKLCLLSLEKYCHQNMDIETMKQRLVQLKEEYLGWSGLLGVCGQLDTTPTLNIWICCQAAFQPAPTPSVSYLIDILLILFHILFFAIKIQDYLILPRMRKLKTNRNFGVKFFLKGTEDQLDFVSIFLISILSRYCILYKQGSAFVFCILI